MQIFVRFSSDFHLPIIDFHPIFSVSRRICPHSGDFQGHVGITFFQWGFLGIRRPLPAYSPKTPMTLTTITLSYSMAAFSANSYGLFVLSTMLNQKYPFVFESKYFLNQRTPLDENFFRLVNTYKGSLKQVALIKDLL